ncbi:hypothetical protein BCR43DRAFT_498714 [Syncephalastrum racemosum]|uniref:Endopeptidase S2P n=1 Tax=Syncephalastrum racemosum TaxID=13706 RepID=A0A1X2H1A8_SYNRA|nr:hypothetical protein BCR43DRAFT_498714 [Syncephalastrum racemosum]
MIFSLGVIAYAACHVLSGLLRLPTAASASTVAHIKRSLDDTNSRSNDQVFLPMIPGVTLPMSHITYYLFALLICGIIHEAGHAIASYSERVPIKSAGIFVYYIYPGAFVNIPDQPLQLLAPKSQLRIVCAGVWHNAVLYLVTLLLLSGGLKSCLEIAGWQSLESEGGVSVVTVRPDSPLAVHLQLSSVIYQLDDLPLQRNILDWNAYLLEDGGKHVPDAGFCAPITSVTEDLACCEIDNEFPFGKAANATVSCFTNFDIQTSPFKSCFTTTDILLAPERQRCNRDTDCLQTGQRCVMPYTPSEAGQIVRLHVRMPPWYPASEKDKMFVFEGELVDIWESVKVGLLRPRFRILPVSLPHMSELLLQYISSFTLALAILNILPVFQLDGQYALEQLVHCWQPSVTTQSTRSQRAAQNIIKGTTVLVGFVLVGSIFLGVLGAA